MSKPKPAKPKLVETIREDNHFGVAVDRLIYEAEVPFFIKIRGQDAFRESTAAERQAWARKAIEAARRREARKRQRVIDKLKATTSACGLG